MICTFSFLFCLLSLFLSLLCKLNKAKDDGVLKQRKEKNASSQKENDNNKSERKENERQQKGKKQLFETNEHISTCISPACKKNKRVRFLLFSSLSRASRRTAHCESNKKKRKEKRFSTQTNKKEVRNNRCENSHSFRSFLSLFCSTTCHRTKTQQTNKWTKQNNLSFLLLCCAMTTRWDSSSSSVFLLFFVFLSKTKDKRNRIFLLLIFDD